MKIVLGDGALFGPEIKHGGSGGIFVGRRERPAVVVGCSASPAEFYLLHRRLGRAAAAAAADRDAGERLMAPAVCLRPRGHAFFISIQRFECPDDRSPLSRRQLSRRATITKSPAGRSLGAVYC